MPKAKQHRLTPQVQATLIKAATDRAPNAEAAAAAGISEKTLYNWLADPELAEFTADYARAKAQGRMRSIKVIAQSDDWRAHAWLLERMDPNNWAKTDLDPGALETLLNAYLQGHDAGKADTKTDA